MFYLIARWRRFFVLHPLRVRRRLPLHLLVVDRDERELARDVARPDETSDERDEQTLLLVLLRAVERLRTLSLLLRR